MRLDGDAIAAASIALGAVGPVVLRARRTEAFLAGQPLTEATMRAAGELVVQEISPIDDVRGSADYRRTLARNMLAKFYYQAQAQLASTP
jgi:CO/xanthine dehydrogenase FAD-binding subunit